MKNVLRQEDLFPGDYDKFKLKDVIRIAKDKYLRKNEFRYNKNPEVRNPRGEGHVAYVTVRHKKRSKINIITHANSFYGEPTQPLRKNPERSRPSKRPSNFSVPVWESNSYLKEQPKGVWRMDNQDRKNIHKFNKRYEKKKNK